MVHTVMVADVADLPEGQRQMLGPLVPGARVRSREQVSVANHAGDPGLAPAGVVTRVGATATEPESLVAEVRWDGQPLLALADPRGLILADEPTAADTHACYGFLRHGVDGLAVCPRCGFRGQPRDHVSWSIAVGAGLSPTAAQLFARRARRWAVS